jgi:hypothetical protein
VRLLALIPNVMEPEGAQQNHEEEEWENEC